MTPTEAVKLVAYVKQLVPAQRFEEYTPDAWHGVLGDLDFDIAIAAAQRVVRLRPFVDPHAIIEQARVIRDQQRRAHRSRALALPGRYEDDDERDARIARHMGACRQAAIDASETWHAKHDRSAT